ncbi:unnamed protein product [Miscanthus lutarioriparius]|uniref:Late embryogenesis abundant protein LEA-2 subgroup domain-containing protein n=1 Tax=Miscanthus lutarioriparius TaxID=422564 RepID=A0A811SAB3_9POAL|nr:unnamed protein product [Miscanthus lutarioriparius]
MAMAPPSSSGQLETKHYNLAALAATLVAAAVVTVVSVMLSPARLSFSVTDARNDFTSHPARLFLTLAAQNPSRRAAVQYWSIFVEVSNSTGLQWFTWMKANVSAYLPLHQPRRSERKVNATVSMVGLAGEEFTGNRTSHSFSVTVTAVARFKVGVAWTRLYDIKRRRSETKVNATVSIVGLAEADAFTSNKTNRKLSVMVAAVARFKVGVAWTRLYDIKVSCGNVDFFANNQSSTADYHAD